jgi:hypothetical protein
LYQSLNTRTSLSRLGLCFVYENLGFNVCRSDLPALVIGVIVARGQWMPYLANKHFGFVGAEPKKFKMLPGQRNPRFLKKKIVLLMLKNT